MIKGHPGNPQDHGVEEAAEHAARAIDHREESRRRAAQAEAEDGRAADDLKRQSTEHAQASHDEEAEAQAAAERADDQRGT
jgi:hypothetical protein